MFQINDDLSINITRGDTAVFTVNALNESGENYLFQKGDVVRIKVTEKKACENVMFQKDFVVEEETEQVELLLTEDETKIGEVISKPTDYWYEVELNPLTNPQTIIGYDEDGAKILRLYPEGNDIEPVEPTPEDIPVVDEELDLTSERPVQNQAIARAFLNIQNEIERIDNDTNITSEDLEPLKSDIDANKTNIAKNTGSIEDLTSNVEELNNHKANTSNPHNVTAEQVSIDKNISGLNSDNVQGAIDDVSRTIGYVKSKNLVRFPYDDARVNTTTNLSGLSYIVDGNGVVTIDGISKETGGFVLNNSKTLVLPKGTYKVNGCPEGGSDTTYSIRVWAYDENDSVYYVAENFGGETTFTLEKETALGVQIRCWAVGVVFNNTVFKPMISKEGGEFEPYTTDVKTYIDDRYSHNTNNIRFPFTAPHSGILTLTIRRGESTAGVIGNTVEIYDKNGNFLRHHYCTSYCNGWGASSFQIPLGKGDVIEIGSGFSGQHNSIYTEKTCFTY